MIGVRTLMGLRIRLLGSWWDSPRGDFPVRAIAARLRELRDAEVIHEGDEYVVSVSLYEDEISYGRAVLAVLKNESFMVLLQGCEDWEAIKEFVREKSGDLKFGNLIEVLRRVASSTSSSVELS